MNRFALLAASLLLAGAGAGADADRLKIVTTTSDLADIAARIAGEEAEVRSVCRGTEDPHFLQARPSTILMARDADLWIRVGMELEIGWEPPVLEGSRNGRIQPGRLGHLDASSAVIKRDVPGGPVSRAGGDIHPSGNPNYLLDPYNARVVAEAMAERIIALRPAVEEAVRGNLERFRRELDGRMFGADLVAEVGGDQLWGASLEGTLEAWLEERDAAARLGGWSLAMAPLRGAKVVTYHKSWTYLLERFGLEVPIELEPKPGIPATAGHLAAVAELMRREGVTIILQEPFYSRKAAERLAKQVEARVVVAAGSVGGTPEATDYMRVIDLVVEALAEL